ncbi:MAG: VCBS repeat-containing protein [Verrucomicrobiota bacterium]
MNNSIVTVFILFLTASPAFSSELSFKLHLLGKKSTYSAAAVDDINGDGQLDIICGGWWYEAPYWRRHFVRDVKKIRGWFDGYSHLPYDVDGDGDTDFINVNYRSKSIYWIEHPDDLLQPWPKHLIAEPGAMETGRLHDIDDDGQLDILPNGNKFAAWWQRQGKKFIRRDLPLQLAGHGTGFGDIDGDGRADIVGLNGWMQAPANRITGKWQWHPEFELKKRPSVPILIVDVDDDGDNDIVWGEGHDYGLFWEEQKIDSKGQRNWQHHLIDQSWSQAHAPLWADLDGDGQDELIAGKRYMAHDGKDPGAHDPLVIYSYQFNKKNKTWEKRLIIKDQQVGFGLDPQVIDLDKDGDLDLVCPGRSGLYWLENQRLP